MLRLRIVLISFGLAAIAFGQPSIYPGQLTIGAAVGSTTPITETANLLLSGTTGQILDFDLSIQYGTGPQGWLSVSPVNGTTPARLTISADPTGLPAGNYSARVLASVGPQRAGAWTTVSFIVAPTSANPGGVSANPASLTFFAPTLTAQTISVSNAPGGSSATAFSVFANPSDWLHVASSDQTTPATVTVQPSSGWSTGTHFGTVTITAVATGKSTVIPVTVSVPDTGIGPTITLTPAQRALTFNYQLNTSLNPQQTVYVSTDSTQYTNFTATASNSWIGVSNASYLAAKATAACFAPGLLFVSIDPTGLSAGVYKGAVTLSAPGLASVDIPVTLTVTAATVFNANPSFVALDARTGLLTSNLAVTASSAFFFSATTSVPWLTISPASAVASPDPANLTVTANVTGLPAGTYNGSITLTAAGGSPSMTVPVQLQTTNDTTAAAALQVSPAALNFLGISGSDMYPQYLVINSAAGVPEQFTVSAVSTNGWLKVDRLSGTTPMNMTVTVDSALPGGLYTGSIVFTSLQSGDHTTVDVTYKVAARVLGALPPTLTFAQQDIGAALAPQEVQIGANAPSTFRIVSQPRWATVVATGFVTPAKLTVSVDPTGIPPGQYEANIQLSGPNDLLIPVALKIPAPPPPSVTPAAISFSYQLGSNPPAAQTIRISNATGPLAFVAAASTVSGINWLTVSPGSGTTPGTIAVNVNVAQLVPGQQPGAVSVTVQDGAGTTVKVPVTLTVTGSTIQIRDVLNAATLGPANLAPGEIVTLTGFGLGPAAPVSARPSAAGAYGTELAGISVLFDGVAAPLLMVQNEQINAVVPYSLYGRVSAKIQVQSGTSYSIPIEVKVVDAAPGIFTTGSSGRGQATAQNADSTPNSPLNPAPRGSVVVLYLTGEGQTDPAGQDGRIIATDLRRPLLPVTALIGGQAAEVQYAGSSPTQVAGLCQVNLLIPQNLDAGTQPVEIQVGGIPSQRGVTLEVR